MFDIRERFKILTIETAEEYIIKRDIKQAEIDRKIEFFLSSQENDCCEGGCKGQRCRLVFGDMYLCYECFYHSLDCEGSVSVPSVSADNMREYVDEFEWDELWEEEHGFIL